MINESKRTENNISVNGCQASNFMVQAKENQDFPHEHPA